jgi:CBS-domain-containing membrane protein
MALEKHCWDFARSDFDTINRNASLKQAYDLLMKNLDGPPHRPGVVVVNDEGKYAGMYCIDDLASDLNKFYKDACAQETRRDWADSFFNLCELAGHTKIGEKLVKRGRNLMGNSPFSKAVEIILDKRVSMVAVLDETGACNGVITRAQVLRELGPKIFK